MEQLLNDFLFNPTIGKVVTLVLAVVIIWTIIKLLKSRWASNLEDKDHRYRFRKVLDLTGYFLMILAFTIIYSNKLGGLTVALGVAGAGIAFALQEVIASVAGWLAIMFAGFYKTGDRVQLGGIKGDVIDISVLRTTIMETGQWVDGDLYNGRIVRIANSFVFKEPVFNYSGDFPFLWDEIKIPVQYGSNYEKAKDIFSAIAVEVVGDYTKMSNQTWEKLVRKYMIENAQTEPMVTLIANDNWVEFTLRYVVSFKKRRMTKDMLFTKILKAVESSGGEIKFASATFHLVEAPVFEVKMKS
ncbi:MAG: mechanosensitive ion channel family protein [Bacteroidetes bacterium]|nr:MAG: mechanosensitive ion channel family protein [Bacteroidota bacterium]REK34830.1 MAG: mechanosensitive ion channel family protein [Bacteroidota bacterium]REK51201.1 MAG: mechanosensitive ion channel family protein [Bacteroidota bacterium]